MAFQVVCDATVTTGTMPEMIVGQGPFEAGTDFGPDYPIYEVPDDNEYAKLGQSGTPWLLSDMTIAVTPDMTQPADSA